MPALERLKLVMELELRGRGDIQLFRVELPGPEGHARHRVGRQGPPVRPALALQRARATTARVRHWREAFESGTVKASGPAEILKLIQNVVEKQEERTRTRKLRAR